MNKDDFIECFRGAASGLTQVIVGHPFDTVKVWLQSPQYNMENASKTIKIGTLTIPYRRLYNGVTAPLLSNSIVNSVFFGISHKVHEYTDNWLVSGAIAGAMGSLVSNPFDVWKINRQIYTKETSNTNIKNLLKFPMYRGLGYSIARESPAMALYFYVYHKLKEEHNISPLVAGAATGLFGWIVTYPVDVIKTRIQSNSANSLKQALSQGNLWRGIMPVLIRAPIVNGASFWVYNYLSEE